ncbi:hypothetical protein GGQ73_003066 [Rhizobium skierniewicense]|uniref:Uncharacterized protein n=1 Tax=Rhizobium skierniewicense TaxID=984260 RepID=A0A7W6CC39_9HYPH|nr:hypothetical protein [Rhizobium skierniewicense]MBB3947102.1 hypothetical protein [Rhizobium skierniewicense]
MPDIPYSASAAPDGVSLPLTFKVTRSDKITTPGMIDTQMINHLIDSDLVICDMSLLNANAFYEMGIRHMTRKPTIHMFVVGTEIPFDVKPYRAIEFSWHQHSHLLEARRQLEEAIRDATAPEHLPDNPVTKAINFQQIEKSATSIDKLLLHELESVKQDLALLKRKRPVGPADSFLSKLKASKPYYTSTSVSEILAQDMPAHIEIVLDSSQLSEPVDEAIHRALGTIESLGWKTEGSRVFLNVYVPKLSEINPIIEKLRIIGFLIVTINPSDRQFDLSGDRSGT